MEQLTDKKFWEDYWQSKKEIYKPIHQNYLFSDLFAKIVAETKPKTAIEIGGFPGFYSILLHKYFGISTSLLDLVVVPSIIDQLCKVNDVSPSAITCYEGDFFSMQPVNQFDLVFSNGFIEHFSDTEAVILQHIKYLKKGGTLLITLPNFNSLNGLFQRVFDPENYNKHYTHCMNRKFLYQVCQKLNLKDIEISYYGYFSIWLEERARKNWLARLSRALLFYPLKVFFRLLKWNTPFFSPYIVIKASYQS